MPGQIVIAKEEEDEQEEEKQRRCLLWGLIVYLPANARNTKFSLFLGWYLLLQNKTPNAYKDK